MEQAEATFYGSVLGYDLASGRSYTMYFFEHNDCFRLKDSVDALFVMTDSKAKLCLNPFSCRYAQLKASPLCAKISPCVADSFADEQAGAGLIATRGGWPAA